MDDGTDWLALLFAHWPVDPETLRPHVPPALRLDTFDGRAWIGITPSRVVGLRLRGLPPLPLVSSFRELNVRTYVTAEGKPGIWFFSLDASSGLAVAGARRLYSLPYHRAEIDFDDGTDVRVEARRIGVPAARLSARYHADGSPASAEPGSLEHFLTERYCLYARRHDRKLLRAEIHHRPWPLQPAGVVLAHEQLVPAGVELLADEPLLHFWRRQDVVVWSTEPVAGGR